MSIERLQTKIRRMKCPVVLDFEMDKSLIPAFIQREERGTLKAFSRFAMEMMDGLRDVVPAVRFDFSEFAVCGTDGLCVLSSLLAYAGRLGYYVLLNAPGALSARSAANNAQNLLAETCPWYFDGLVLSQSIGTDAIKPYAAERVTHKSLFAVVRTANKSGSEMQDIMTGTEFVHIAQAEKIHRIAVANSGSSGFCTIGVMAAATNSCSLQILRRRYQRLFILVDGYDAPNANTRNCSMAFDEPGHGAAICVGRSITGAWKETPFEESFVEAAIESLGRVKRNINRYITIL